MNETSKKKKNRKKICVFIHYIEKSSSSPSSLFYLSALLFFFFHRSRYTVFFSLSLSLPCFSPLFWRLTQFLLCLDYELLCGCVFGVGVACVNFIENNKNATQFTQPKPICRSNARTVFEWKLCTSRMCETRKQKLWKKLGSKSKGRRQEKWKHTLARKP